MDVLGERERKSLFLILAIAIVLTGYFLPPPPGLSPEGEFMISVLLASVVLFIVEPIPLGISSLLIMVLPPLFNIMSAEEIFSLFGNRALFFLIGAFILAAGFRKSGLHERVANKFLALTGKSTKRFILGVMLLGALLSFIMTVHAVVAILTPMVVAILMKSGIGPKTNSGKATLIALAYGSSVGSVGTLLGGARNPYTVAYLKNTVGIDVSFLQWSMYTMPIVFLSLPAVYLIITKLYPPDAEIIAPEGERTPMRNEEKISACIMAATILLLIFFSSYIETAIIVILGAVAMFATGILDWRDAEREIPWGIVLLYGAAITVGKGLYITGAASYMAGGIASLCMGNVHVALLLMILSTICLTEVMSNTAAVAVVLPMAIEVARVFGINPLVFAIAVAVAGGFAFILVIATPGNLITYATGYYGKRDLVKAGLPCNLAGTLIIYFVAEVLWRFMGAW